MKRLFLRLLMLISFAVMMSACAQSKRSSQVSGDVPVRVPMAKDGTYSLEVVNLLSISNLAEVAGKFAEFIFSPSIIDAKLSGSAPQAAFLKSGSVYVAEDDLSLQMATIYAHTQNLAQLDQDLGVGSVNKWPRQIGVRVMTSSGSTNNAFYDGSTDSMLFIPFTGSELPLSANAGVIAHEHFHSLFYKLVIQEVAKSKRSNIVALGYSAHSQKDFYDKFNLSGASAGSIEVSDVSDEDRYMSVFVRGINEGLADYWGWVYTGDVDFVKRSISRETTRSLQSEDYWDFVSTDRLKSDIKTLTTDSTSETQGNLLAYAYTLGTKYSRVFKSFADTVATSRSLSSLEARKQVAKYILQALPQLKTDIILLKTTDFYEPSQFLRAVVAQVKDAHADECQFMASILTYASTDNSETDECAKSSDDKGWVINKKTTPSTQKSSADNSKKTATVAKMRENPNR